MNWFRRYASGPHAGEWPALALAVLLIFALGIALLRLVSWLHQRKRDTNEGEDESEMDYWHIHGG